MLPGNQSRDELKINHQDIQNISTIFAEHGAFLMSVIKTKFTPQPDVDLEDLFQDLFVSLAEKPVPSDVKCVKSYLYKAVNNDIKDQYRKAKNFRKLRSNHLYYRKLKNRAMSEEPTGQVEYKDTLDYIDQKASEHLPEHEAMAVKQKVFHENNTADSADQLNISKRSFSHYLCTGLKRLRRCLPDLEPSS